MCTQKLLYGQICVTQKEFHHRLKQQLALSSISIPIKKHNTIQANYLIKNKNNKSPSRVVFRMLLKFVIVAALRVKKKQRSNSTGKSVHNGPR